MKRTLLKITSVWMMFTLAFQLAFPICSYALTSGPTQPEVESFEPVGTTDMVDMFTGDFNYNIPLMDVEGYPINIAYHSGINMEQEASWVGLGWNINPGEINRVVRGIPDDFNGEKIEKEYNIKAEKNVRVGTGADIPIEALGFSTQELGFDVSLSFGLYVNFNNYRGVGIGTNVGATVSTPIASTGIDMGIGSQTGADLDANLSFYTSKDMTNDAGAGASISGGTGFNSRTGLKDLSFGIGVGSGYNHIGRPSIDWLSYGSTIPIGLQNYVPVVTSESHQSSFQFQVKGGAEVCYTFPHLYLNAMITNVNYDQDGSRNGYGYMYTENADKWSIRDFSRDKDGIYNKTLPNLPPSAMTYDIYSVSGQGTGGMFRPFRNDIGTISDPYMESPGGGNDVLTEFGVGDLFEAGSDINFYNNDNISGSWIDVPFGSDVKGSPYEKVFFRQGGEMTYNQQQSATQIFNTAPEYLNETLNLIGKGNSTIGVLPATYNGTHIYWDGTNIDRSSRADMISFLTNKEASVPEIGQFNKIPSYATTSPSRYFDPETDTFSRYDTLPAKAKSYSIGEITQTQKDGRRYVYSIPVMNNMTREATFAVNESNANPATGMVKIVRGGSHDDDSKGNNEGIDNFYSSTNTPAYAHSYLLTSVLSRDYVDITGNGPSDDDPGSYVKYNYTMVDSDYRWRSPYSSDPSVDSAQYNPGFRTDHTDGRGSYIIGSRKVWLLRSVESKNYIAEFYVTARNDGMGAKSAVLPSTSSLTKGNNLGSTGSNSHSYELDSIALYNKHDYYINENNATPIKTVIFQYSYDLCKGIPNTFSPGSGKLTLQKIFIRYGKSQKNLLNPYVFTYNNPNPNYDFAAKDRWGDYKKNDPSLPNVDFPYAQQDGTGLDDSLASWNLTDIKLPSGGKIHVQYEGDDYSFVQDKRTMQMDMVAGIGSSPLLEHKTHLYEDASTINDYVYFKRRSSLENRNLSLRDNYLEGSNTLYYNFYLDITGSGRYEFTKGYATVADIGICPNDTSYGYIKLQRESAGNMKLHPATVYGINVARYYLPQYLYHGFSVGDGSDTKAILLGLIQAAGEMGSLFSNPFDRFIKEGKGKNVNLAESWVRLQVPGLTKKGGGIRVKELTFDDSWSTLSGNPDDATYGKQYDYTISDPRYGTISSGVASYEPVTGGDENPFRQPVNYTAQGGRLLPAIDFYQEEPYGEQFFPAPVVGYSSVKVKSIHAAVGRSSQSLDEYLFYTAKDFPLSVDYTAKHDPGPYKSKTLTNNYEDERVLQGYTLTFNDMHGKPRAVNNYIIKTDGTNVQNELVTSVKYNYQTDATGKLNNTVKALVRNRGTQNTYSVKDITIGEDVDLTLDSREHDFTNFRSTVKLNLNAVLWGLFLIPVPTVFSPDKMEQQIFRTFVTTKIVQQYGVISSVETYDHGASTTTMNLIYDGETGTPILTQTNNEYNDNHYNMKYPAYMAYQGMGPAYLNTGFMDAVDTMMVDINHNCVIYSNHLTSFNPGDELLVSYNDKNGNPFNRKLWVTGAGIDTFGTGQNVTTTTYDSTCALTYQTRSTDGGSGGIYKNTEYNPCTHDSVTFYDTIPSGSGTYKHYYFSLNITPHSSTQYVGSHGPNKCALFVAPRYMYKNSTPWSDTGVFYGVNVKVVRSGRRNNLDAYVQQTSLTQNPYSSGVNDLFMPSGSNPFNKVLGVSVNTYTDTARPYGDSANMNLFSIPSGPYAAGDSFSRFNAYVMGWLGNYRPQAQYTSLSQRSYASNHVRYDGIFSLPQLLWNFNNGYTLSGCTVGVGNVLSIPTPNSQYWVRSNNVTKYDIYGNALEEVDPTGIYSSAQYGYNRTLPIAVATNVNQGGFFYDGFEDYIMLLPEYTRRLHYIPNHSSYGSNPYDNYLYAPFNQFFTNFRSFGAGSGTTDPTMLVRSGQRFSILDTNSSTASGNKLTTEASHSGYYSLKIANASGLTFSVANTAADPSFNTSFHIVPGNKYVFDFWVKPVTGSITTLANAFTLTVGSTVNHLQLKTNSIDGWYLLEGIIDPGSSAVTVYVPQNVYVDDIRAFPDNANMKSFVYDPLTMKLIAQLDENNFATFYEYDQQGLLVRTKKETERGILTVSESRSANSKK